MNLHDGDSMRQMDEKLAGFDPGWESRANWDDPMTEPCDAGQRYMEEKLCC